MEAFPLWQAAVSYAARAHDGHVRKDGRTPYIAHVIRVTMTVMQIFGCDDEETLAAAVLHDTIEDTPTDYDDIADRFGVPVAEMVAALTKNMLLPETEREPDYDARLARADWRARLIKLGDVYDNTSDYLARRSGSGGAKGRKLAEKCRRAIVLAEPDAREHPETRRGIEAVQAIVRRLKVEMASAPAGGDNFP